MPKGQPPTSTTRHGNGAGWGGSAKGGGKGGAKPFEPGNDDAVGRDAPDWAAVTERRQQAELVKDQLYELAMSAENHQVRVAAADKFLSRIEGAPLARNLNFTTDDISALDDASLADRRATLERAVGSGAGGAETPDDPARPDGVVH